MAKLKTRQALFQSPMISFLTYSPETGHVKKAENLSALPMSVLWGHHTPKSTKGVPPLPIRKASADKWSPVTSSPSVGSSPSFELVFQCSIMLLKTPGCRG